MKTNRTTDDGAESRSPRSRPPPVVHPKSEPEYDTEQVTRRANAVTGVLEKILKEHPAEEPVPPYEPPLPRANP